MADLQQVYRLDLSSGEVKARKRTPQGGLVADANLTRTGVFPYRMEGGGTRRELRSPEGQGRGARQDRCESGQSAHRFDSSFFSSFSIRLAIEAGY